MKFTLKSIVVLMTTAIYTSAASQSTALKKQNGYLASKTSGSISLLSRWDSFKLNRNKTFKDPQQRMLYQMGINISEPKNLSNKYDFYGGEAYKGNNVPYASITDGEGNTYITGGSSNENQVSGDFFTIKVGRDGQTLWEKREQAAQYAVEYGMHIAFDNSGKIIVSGVKWNGNDMDIRVLKYDTDGSKLWDTTFDNNAEGLEIPNSITTDSSGNIYITGIAWSGNSVNYLTLKYNSNGVEQWHRSENPAGGETWNEATALAVDNNDNVLVTGYSPNTDGWLNYHTIKYNSEGAKLWEQTYNYESTDPENIADVTNSVPQAITTDNDGNIYVTGTFDTYLNRIGTIKYNAQGQQQWIKTYKSEEDGTFGWNVAFKNNKLYVAGSHSGGFADDGTVLLSYNTDGTENWAKETSDLITNSTASLNFDTQGNIIASSNGMTPGAEEWEQDVAACAYKYSPEGDLLGQSAFVISTSTGLASMGQMAGVGTDNDDNIYFSVNSYYTEKGSVFETVKSKFGNTSPSTEWNAVFSNKGTTEATMLNSFNDKNGNTFSTGSYYSYSDNMLNNNYFLVKHNAEGSVAWKNVFNSENGNPADGIIARADANGNTYVCLLPGFEQFPPALKVMKFSPDGTQLWSQNIELYNPQVYVMEPQADGSVYLGGTAKETENGETSFLGIKLSSNGSQEWKTYMPGLNGNTIYRISDGKVDSNQRLILTGAHGTGNFMSQNINLTAVQFNADGSPGWITPVAVDGLSSSGTNLYISDDNSIYINGYTTDNETFFEDIITAKISPAGNILWSKTFGETDKNERSYTIKPFSNGDIAVVGYSLAINGDINNELVKYSPTGEQIWNVKSENMRYYNDFYIDASDVSYIMNQTLIDPFPHKIFSQPFPIASLLKIDKNGMNKGETFFTGPEYAEFFGERLIPHSDGRLLLAGSVSNQSFYKGLYFFETEHDAVLGLSDGLIPSTTQDTLGQNYPNPASNSTTIPFNLINGGKVIIKLYSTQGSLIKEISNGVYSKGSNRITFNTNDLPTGIYFYQIESSGIKQVKKMIIK
ncbi:T9SS type A sorting domain-containing protein [Epilithonimonas zeae]|uniref:T9SS type A sorting domain-containing protein n=1 Tax=Epilithonimonas zeae TaxID=1416779 RepID=UPI00200E2D79|nr:T9SS type A sorting domain-containing protein [Epilithonimonas zeae]UQB69337.1 T9SS type A sorting domain-containing protein [Epilithonimonas zeae]